MSEHFSVLIVGGGPAAFATVEAYRAAGGSGPVAMISDEGRMPYNRPPLTKALLTGESDETTLPLAEETWLAENHAWLINGRAVRLESRAHAVTLSGGRRLTYETCVLATGAEPHRLPIPGADHLGVRVVRGLLDVRELLGRLAPGKPVVVIGSGFIGCEIAASLRLRGHPVSLVSDEPAPNQARLGEHAAARLRAWLEDAGVQLTLSEKAESIEPTGAGAAAGFEVVTSSRRLAGAVVVMAAGVAPRSELADADGLNTEGGAIVVDDSMRTSHEDVLAAGDVSKALNRSAGRRLRVEHWGDALGQGRIAGQTAAGQRAAWSEVPGFWSTIGTHTLKYAAWGDGFDQTRLEDHGEGAFTAWYGREGRLAGVLTHHRDEDYERGREMIEHGEPWR